MIAINNGTLVSAEIIGESSYKKPEGRYKYQLRDFFWSRMYDVRWQRNVTGSLQFSNNDQVKR